MRYSYGRTYTIFKSPDSTIYFENRGKLIYIYRVEGTISNSMGELWLNEGYKDLLLLHQIESSTYILLEDIHNNGIIMEIVSKKIILSDFRYNEFIYSSHRTIEGISAKSLFLAKKSMMNMFEPICFFRNEVTNEFSVFSLYKGFIYGPSHYQTIDIYKNGVILNRTIAILKNSTIEDITGYIQKEKLFVNEDKRQYKLLIDKDGVLLLQLNKVNKYLFAAEFNKIIYSYDVLQDVINYESTLVDNDNSFPGSMDEAYEGYSRLELGLD